MTLAVSIAQSGANNVTMRNRIINGAMMIDQRNAGASVTLTSAGVFPVDRFQCDEDTDGVMTGQQSTTAPAGFINSLLITTTTADASLGSTQYAAIVQKVEGLNCADLAWGTASAQPITVSFWVRSSLTGTFGGAVANSAHNRSYPFTYTISSANTWEQKSVTIAGDTSGTWLTTNGTGIRLFFGLGVGSTYSGTAGAWAGATYISATGATSVVGTLNATFYITGVQLEEGTTATPFEQRLYGQELALCQRYYYYAGVSQGAGYQDGSTGIQATFSTPVPMRATPTLTTAGTTYLWRHNGYSSQSSPSNTVNSYTGCSLLFTISGYSGGVNGYVATWYSNITCSAEL